MDAAVLQFDRESYASLNDDSFSKLSFKSFCLQKNGVRISSMPKGEFNAQKFGVIRALDK